MQDYDYEAIADRLKTGGTIRQIVSELGCTYRAVLGVRRCLKMPSTPGPKPLTPDAMWAGRTVRTDDGHLLWTGTVRSDGVPLMCHADRHTTAFQWGWKLATGRWPDGHLRRICGVEGCVDPEHTNFPPSAARLVAAALTSAHSRTPERPAMPTPTATALAQAAHLGLRQMPWTVRPHPEPRSRQHPWLWACDTPDCTGAGVGVSGLDAHQAAATHHLSKHV